MTKRLQIASYCYAVSAVLLAAFGLYYLFTPRFMPYHAVAIGASWEELSPAYQVLFLGLLKVAGAGLLGSGVAMGVMLLIPLRAGVSWARWSIPLVGLLVGSPTLYATLSVQFSTPASAPWIAPALGLLLTVIGFLLTIGEKSDSV